MNTQAIHITILPAALSPNGAPCVITNMRQPVRGNRLTVEESDALGCINLQRAAGRVVFYSQETLLNLAENILDPETFGHASTAEMRDAARAALGMPGGEAIRA